MLQRKYIVKCNIDLEHNNVSVGGIQWAEARADLWILCSTPLIEFSKSPATHK